MTWVVASHTLSSENKNRPKTKYNHLFRVILPNQQKEYINTTLKLTSQENGNNPTAVIKVNLVALIPKKCHHHTGCPCGAQLTSSETGRSTVYQVTVIRQCSLQNHKFASTVYTRNWNWTPAKLLARLRFDANCLPIHVLKGIEHTWHTKNECYFSSKCKLLALINQ